MSLGCQQDNQGTSKLISDQYNLAASHVSTVVTDADTSIVMTGKIEGMVLESLKGHKRGRRTENSWKNTRFWSYKGCWYSWPNSDKLCPGRCTRDRSEQQRQAGVLVVVPLGGLLCSVEWSRTSPYRDPTLFNSLESCAGSESTPFLGDFVSDLSHGLQLAGKQDTGSAGPVLQAVHQASQPNLRKGIIGSMVKMAIEQLS